MADSISQKIYYPSERPPGHGEGTELAGRPWAPRAWFSAGCLAAPHMSGMGLRHSSQEGAASIPTPQLTSDPRRQEPSPALGPSANPRPGPGAPSRVPVCSLMSPVGAASSSAARRLPHRVVFQAEAVGTTGSVRLSLQTFRAGRQGRARGAGSQPVPPRGGLRVLTCLAPNNPKALVLAAFPVERPTHRKVLEFASDVGVAKGCGRDWRSDFSV